MIPYAAPMFDLGGRVALVTGGSRGLGLQIAAALGEYGARIALAARNVEELDSAVSLLAERGVDAVALPTDLSSAKAAADLPNRVVGALGRLDILVNNAGAAWGAPAETYPGEGWNKVIDLGLTGLFLLTQAAASACFLPQGRGVVLNVASIEGLRGHHHSRMGTIAYNTAKGGVINMTRALAAEWGPRGIRVNAIAPGFFPSRMSAGTVSRHEAEMIDETPVGRLGGPGDLMGAALLLTSDAGAHITGQILAVDGGATAI